MTDVRPGFIGHDPPDLTREPEVRIVTQPDTEKPFGIVTLASGIHAYIYDPAAARSIAAAFIRLSELLALARVLPEMGGSES